MLLVLNMCFLFGRQWAIGQGVTGMNHPVTWGFYIINFVFFIGISHAGTLISAILFLLRQKWRTSINRFEDFTRVEELYEMEPRYEERAQLALKEGRFFPGSPMPIIDSIARVRASPARSSASRHSRPRSRKRRRCGRGPWSSWVEDGCRRT